MKKILSLLFAVLGWFAVIAQFILMAENRSASIAETIIRFFSFFTILTNTLVSVYFTFQVLGGGKNPKQFFNRPGSLTAIAIYITVVGMVYQVVLRHTWQPTGLQMIVDELLHTFIPALVIIYWALYENKPKVKWNSIFMILLYPVAYLVFILIRGAAAGFYPYPFINVIELGWSHIIANIAILLLVFCTLFVLFVGIGKFISQQKL